MTSANKKCNKLCYMYTYLERQNAIYCRITNGCMIFWICIKRISHLNVSLLLNFYIINKIKPHFVYKFPKLGKKSLVFKPKGTT